MNKNQFKKIRDFFQRQSNNPFYQHLDQNRINYQRLNQKKYLGENDQKNDDKAKKVINMDLFRQDTRRQQRQFHQQNHQYLKMCGVIVRSSFDKDKFGFIGQSKKAGNFSKGNNNNKNVHKQAPIVRLSLDETNFNCSLHPKQFPIKQLYNLTPFRKQSILFQSHQSLNSQYIFFLFEYHNFNSQKLKNNINNAQSQKRIEDNILSEFKHFINKEFKYMGFFDYLYFINKQSVQQKVDRMKQYPQYVLGIAQANINFLNKMQEEQKLLCNHNAISVKQQQTCQRIVICEDSDLFDNGESLCFESIDQYTDYKKQKVNQFKFQKIFEKDAIVNTNIRNIISTEKIYLVEIIEEVKSYIQLSIQCEGTSIMNKVYEHLINKADQYLRLLCGYTESKILTIFNIENYQEKIYTFLEKSIRYNKQVRNIPPSLLKEFPVLQIWFQLPENLLGYSRTELHETFYNLMEAIIVFEQKMRANNLYDSLKIRRPGVKYV